MALQKARANPQGRMKLSHRCLMSLAILSALVGTALTAVLIVDPSLDLRWWCAGVLAAEFPGFAVASFRMRLGRGRWSRSRRSRVRRWVSASGSGVVAAAAAVAGWSRAGRFIGNPRLIGGHYYLYGHDKMTEVTRDKYLQVTNSNSLLVLAAALLFTAISLVGLIGWEPDRSS